MATHAPMVEVHVVERRTFLEFRREANEWEPCGHRRSRSLTDTFVEYKPFPADDCETSCGDSSEDSRETESLCSWSTDHEEVENPVAEKGNLGCAQPQSGYMWVAVPVPCFATAIPMWAACPQVIQSKQSGIGATTNMESVVSSEHQEVPVATSGRRRCRGSRREAQSSAPNRAEPCVDAVARASQQMASEVCETLPEHERTTIIFRNLPSDCSRDDLIRTLESQGFSGLFDFVHVPVNFQAMVGNGYGLVNMVSNAAAERALLYFQGWSQWQTEASPACDLGWSNALQGLTAHVDRYRDSPVMHESIGEQFKPALFSAGSRIAFPEPTKQLRAPRVRHNKSRLAE